MSSMSDPALAPCERPLTDRERGLLAWLIEHCTYGDRPTLRAQIPRLASESVVPAAVPLCTSQSMERQFRGKVSAS
jgi:hypothetical protein